MSETHSSAEFEIHCPGCGCLLAASSIEEGSVVECPYCHRAFRVQLTANESHRRNKARHQVVLVSARRFNFRCKRCRSVLEALADQAATTGRCPSCGAEFTIPALDPHSGLALGDADPGNDGYDPTPVHAYAAAGAKAPQFERNAFGELVIHCPRCGRQAPVDADGCSSCGLPFTLEGTPAIPRSHRVSDSVLALIFGIIALGSFGCAVPLPALLAVGLGVRALLNSARGSGRERTGLALSGVVAGLVGLGLWVVLAGA